MISKMIERIKQAILKALAEAVIPFIDDRPTTSQILKAPGLSEDEMIRQTNDELRGFQQGKIATSFRIEQNYLILDQVQEDRKRAEQDLELEKKRLDEMKADETTEVPLIQEVEEAVKVKENAVKQLDELKVKTELDLADAKDRHMRQTAYIQLLTTRLNSGEKNMLDFQFKSTDEMRGQ